MAETHGRTVIAYVDVGSSTWTAFADEISSTYNISGEASRAVNKSSTGAAGADYAPGAVHTITLSSHWDDTTIDAALDKVMTDIRAQTKTPTRFDEGSPGDVYEGNVVWTGLGKNAPNDFVTNDITGTFDGLPTQTAS